MYIKYVGLHCDDCKKKFSDEDIAFGRVAEMDGLHLCKGTCYADYVEYVGDDDTLFNSRSHEDFIQQYGNRQQRERKANSILDDLLAEAV